MALRPLSPLLDGELVVTLRRHCAVNGLKIRSVVEDAIKSGLDQQLVPDRKPEPAREHDVLQIGVAIEEHLFRQMKVFCVENRLTMRAFLDGALRSRLGTEIAYHPNPRQAG